MNLTRLVTRLALCAGVLASLAGCVTSDWSRSGDFASDSEFREIGTVEVEKELWNPLWTYPKDRRLTDMLVATERSVRDHHGEDALVGNIEIVGRWSPLSLVFGFGAFGMVERTSAIATVYEAMPPPAPYPAPVAPEPIVEPAPPAEPQPEPLWVTVVSFPIEPTAEIEDKFGYMRIEYIEFTEAVEAIRNRLTRRDALEKQIERAISEIEPGGVVRVHIGRQELLHADTQWYDYAIEQSEAGYDRQGVEGIPNIRGRDGNWWNVVDLPIFSPITDKINITIYDTRELVEYRYSVIRNERVVEVESS